jgi:hypothetical protein
MYEMKWNWLVYIIELVFIWLIGMDGWINLKQF